MPALEAFIATYGLVVVLIGTMVEGETVAIMGGFLAHQGVISGRWVLAAAFAGSFIADETLFFIGRRFASHPAVMRQRTRPLFARALARVEASPVAFLLAFRFLYGIRTVSPLAIGVSNVSAKLFVFLNLIAAFVWACLYVGIGYAFGRTIEATFGRFHAIEHKLIAMIAVGIVAYAVLYFLHKRFSQQAQN
jgi:membrane protein DedA with SNARE-associated domain